MFKASLEKKLKAIFGVSKVTFNAPSDAFEQDCIFIELEGAPLISTGGGSAKAQERAKVTGSIVMFSQDNKLPYGFFNKRLEQASATDKAGLAFYNLDQDVASSPARIQNIHERRCRFVFFYKGEYDPNQGELDEVVFT